MYAAITALEIALKTLENNEPINRKEGNLAQADADAVNAASIRQALAVLRAANDGLVWPAPTAGIVSAAKELKKSTKKLLKTMALDRKLHKL